MVIGVSGGSPYSSGPPSPESDQILDEVLAELGIAMGQAGHVEKFDPQQISHLISDLQQIPSGDPNYRTAQTTIRLLQSFEQNHGIEDLGHGYFTLFQSVFSQGTSEGAAAYLTDQQKLEIAFGQLGVAKFDPGQAGVAVDNALFLLHQLPQPWESPLVTQSVAALQQSPPNITSALSNLAQICIP